VTAHLSGGGGGAQPHMAVLTISDRWDVVNNTRIPFDGIDFDTDGFLSVTDQGIKIPAGLAGAYLFTGYVPWSNSANAVTKVQAQFDFGVELVLSSPVDQRSVDPTIEHNPAQTISAMGRFAVGDTIGVIVRGDATSGTTRIDGSAFFGVAYLGSVA
jgi:hypothetical protein